MKIIGGMVTSRIGQQRKRDHVLDAARRRAYRNTRNVSTSGASLSTGATDVVSLARQRIQQSFPQSEVHVGICSSPVSVSFPDGKVHPGMDKL